MLLPMANELDNPQVIADAKAGFASVVADLRAAAPAMKTGPEFTLTHDGRLLTRMGKQIPQPAKVIK